MRWATTFQAPKPNYIYEHVGSKNGEDSSRENASTRFRIVRGIHLSECNLQMQESLNKGFSRNVLQIAAHMKRSGIAPDLETYVNILTALATECVDLAAWATIRDMQAVGIEPDISCLNQVLRVSSLTPCNFLSPDIFALKAFRRSVSTHVDRIFQEIEALGLQPNKETYEILVEYFVTGDNVEMALSKLNEMQELGFTPSLNSVKPVVESLADAGHIQLALEIVEAYVSKSGRRLPGDTWVRLLVASAENLNVRMISKV